MNKQEIEKKFIEIRELIDNDLEQALSELDKINSETLCEELRYDYYYLTGNIHYERNDFDNAIIFYNLALKNQNLDNKTKGKIYGNLSNIYFDKDLFEESIIYGKKTLELAEDKKNLTKALDTMGLSYQHLTKFDDSAKCFLRILEIYNEVRDTDWSKNVIENAYASLAFSCWKLGDEEKSEYYYQKLISLKDADSYSLKRAYICKAHRLYEKALWSEALMYYNKAIELMTSEEDKQFYQQYIDACKKRMLL